MSKKISLGRDDAGKADILLQGSTISAIHAELHIDYNGTLLIRDLGSSNGTSILRNGNIINVLSQSIPLVSSDILYFGDKSFSMEKLLSKLPKDRNSSSFSVPTPQNGIFGKMIRCLTCGSVTPAGSTCKECGFYE